jgi:hypothetical protein
LTQEFNNENLQLQKEIDELKKSNLEFLQTLKELQPKENDFMEIPLPENNDNDIVSNKKRKISLRNNQECKKSKVTTRNCNKSSTKGKKCGLCEVRGTALICKRGPLGKKKKVVFF